MQTHVGGSHIVLLWVDETDVTYTKCLKDMSYTASLGIEGTNVIYKEKHDTRSHIVLLWTHGTDVPYTQCHKGCVSHRVVLDR